MSLQVCKLPQPLPPLHLPVAALAIWQLWPPPPPLLHCLPACLCMHAGDYSDQGEEVQIAHYRLDRQQGAAGVVAS